MAEEIADFNELRKFTQFENRNELNMQIAGNYTSYDFNGDYNRVVAAGKTAVI